MVLALRPEAGTLKMRWVCKFAILPAKKSFEYCYRLIKC